MNALALTPSDLFVLEVVLKGTLLLAAAFALAFVLQRASAATRHAVWSLAFAGLLLLPLCVALLPAWQVAVPGLSGIEVLRPERSEPVALSEPTPPTFESTTIVDPKGAIAFEYTLPEDLIQPIPPLEPLTPVAAAGVSGWSWPGIALLLWIGGAIALLVRLALVLSKLSLLSRRAEPVTDPEWLELTEVLSEVLDIRRPVRLLRHEEIVVPMTYGVRRPVILLPMHTDDWSEDQKHVTLMHELLHVKRYDHLVHVLALCARALHWFTPLALAATKRLLVERERACDDGVLAMGVASATYADHLLSMARHVLTGREASAGALAMARPTELRSRIVAILDPGQRRHALTRVRAFGMAACALLLVIPLAAMQPGESEAQTPKFTAQEAQQNAFKWEQKPDIAVPDIEVPDIHVDVDTEAITASVNEAVRGLAGLERLAELEGLKELERLAELKGLQEFKGLEKDVMRDALNSIKSIQVTVNGLPVDTSEFETQKRALHAIAQLPPEQSIPRLADIARTHGNPAIRAEAIFWLGQEGDASVADLLEDFARNDGSREIRKRAVFALSQLDRGAGVESLTNLARTHPDTETRAEALFWISQEGGPEAASVLEEFAQNDHSRDVQKKAIFGLSQLNEEVGVPRLANLAKTHESAEMRAEAVFWLGQTGEARVANDLATIARSDAATEVQKKAIFSLAQLGEAGVPQLIDLARTHPDANMRSEAVFWLGETGDPRAADLLMEIVRGN